jgi:hypothetical protein
MEYPVLTKKPLEKFTGTPNLQNYRNIYESFSWNKLAQELDWFDGQHINIGAMWRSIRFPIYRD